MWSSLLSRHTHLQYVHTLCAQDLHRGNILYFWVDGLSSIQTLNQSIHLLTKSFISHAYHRYTSKGRFPPKANIFLFTFRNIKCWYMSDEIKDLTQLLWHAAWSCEVWVKWHHLLIQNMMPDMILIISYLAVRPKRWRDFFLIVEKNGVSMTWKPRQNKRRVLVMSCDQSVYFGQGHM